MCSDWKKFHCKMTERFIGKNFAMKFFKMIFTIFATVFKKRKMKKSIFLAMALTAACMFVSCKKEHLGITFGDTKGMIVTPCDTIALQQDPYSPTLWLYDVDLNGDGDGDLMLSLRTYTSYNGRHAAIHCYDKKEDARILCKNVEKTVYIHTETTQTTDGDTTHVYIDKTYTCHRIDKNDEIDRTEEKAIIQAFDAGDLFVLNKNSFPAHALLYSALEESNYTEGEHTNYQIHNHYLHKNDWDYFPLDVEKYIGFRITEADGFRYGWMKIMLFNDNGEYSVRLIETAIQE